MSEFFLKIVNRSIAAGWLILTVLLLRLMIKKAPKWAGVLLWGIVALRLLLPFSIQSALSMIPSAETVSPEIMMDAAPTIDTGVPVLNNAVNPVISRSFAPPATLTSANPLQILIPILAAVWLIGMIGFLAYAVVSYGRLRRRVGAAVPLRDNIFQSELVSSPFVLGVLRPKIYLPFPLDGRDREHVIAHEQAHISRRDHWWKPLGFLLLAVHWFNPLMWLAYTLLCRDIELACDEAVIRELGSEQRADYAEALVSCSTGRRIPAACPLAFGEVGVKERVKSVLRYKKPPFVKVAASVLLCALVAAGFLTDPVTAAEFAMTGRNVSELASQNIVSRIITAKKLDRGANIYTGPDNFDLTLTSDFDWAGPEAIRFFYFKGRTAYSAQLRIFPEENKLFVTESSKWAGSQNLFLLQNLLQALQYLPREEIAALASGADRYVLLQRGDGTPDAYDRVITYTRSGAGAIDGWYIHLEVQPLYEDPDGGYSGTGDDVIHLFYGDAETPRAGNARGGGV